MNRFKRGLAILLSTCMIGGMIPLPASAEETVSENIVQTECIEKTENLENAPSEDEKSSETVHETGSETESETVTDAETEGTAISAIQALIDALPDADSITEDNVENVTSQLDTIDEAKAELSDADMLQLDLTRYDAASDKVMVLMGMKEENDSEIAVQANDSAGKTEQQSTDEAIVYQPAVETTDKYDIDDDGEKETVYEISNAGQLYWFAGLVNGTLDGVEQNTLANAVLTANITVNENLLDSLQYDTEGNVSNGSDFITWTPIADWMGNRTTQYSGTFDGNNKTVSGLYFNGDSTCIGLFGSSESDGNIKNVGVVDSYFKGNDHVGGVCGNNAGTITNCYNAGNLTAIESSADIGGICGYNNGGTIANCYNTGTVTAIGTVAFVGGVCGCSTELILNCYNIGTVTAASSDADISGICGYNFGPIKNCYYLADTEDENGGKTAAQFASGEIAYLLSQGCTVGEGEDAVTYSGSVWGQALGGNGDTYPVLDSTKRVYQVDKYDGCEGKPGSSTKIYSNQSTSIYEEHKYEADTTDSTKHKCSICNGTEEHSFAYELVENGNAIKATCSECGATYTVKLTQPAATSDEKIVYDGTEKKAGTAIDSGNTGIETISENAITYAGVTNGTLSTYSTTAPKNAGTYKAKLTLGTGDNIVSIEINFTIEKAASPTIAGEEKSYIYSIGSDGKTIGVDIVGKLPTDRGITTYAVAKTDTEQLLSEVTVDTAGNLTYKVNQVDSTKVGKTAIITVTASMENYANAGYTLTISIKDKKIVEIKGGNSVSVDGSNVLIYGEKISKLTLGNTVFVEAGTDDVIEGILSWSNPDEIPAAGTTQAVWIFKPTDSRHYFELIGTAAITVAKATPIVVKVPTVAEREYNPDAALTDSDMTGGSVTGADGSSIAGTWSFTGTNIIPTVNNKGYQAVFTPDDADNYNTVTRTITVKVTKATPAVVTVPAVAERVYNPAVALADSDMTGGSVTGADGNELAGTWSFTGKNIIPTVNNKGYQAVFTPDDANNYSTVTRTITVKVTKATLVIAEKPTAGALTYGQKLSDSTLTGGKAAYQTADGTEITGAFAWKNGSIKPTAADSQKTEYDVTFTPSDKDNYNAVDTKLALTVNKAAQAPNMPQAAMAPAQSTKKVGDITLPDGWSWQEADKDTALADGVAVTATAVYTGADKGNYETESVSITITRSKCDHTHTEIRNQREATCKKEGYTGDTYCKDCGEKLATGTATEKKPHTVGTPATCVSKAVCSVCSETFGEVDATNHVHTTVKNRKEATCTQTGYAGDTYCTDCDKLLSTGKELAALGHDYKATVTKQPTTTEEGIRTYTCTRCNSSYTESIAKLPEEQHTHNYTGSITKEATCTEAGVRTYTCSCGDSYTENIPATGHSYVSKVTKAATTTEEGIMTYTCSKCGHSYTQPIAKIKSDDSSKDNGSQNQKPQTGTDNGNQNQKPQPDTDNGNEKGDSIKPYIKDDSGKEGWDVIKPQLEEAKSGDTVTVVMNGTTVVPKDVIDSIKGKDTTLVLDMGNGLSWKIYGKDITDAAGDIDFDVTVGADAGKSIPVDVINNVTGEHSSLNLTLAYDGEFGFTATLTVNMESKNAGLYANLFYYNEQTGELEFISAGQIDPDGNVELVFTHASDYTIVVDAKIMSDNGQADNKSDETIPAPKTDDSTSKYAWNNTIIIIIGICIILIVFGAVFYVRKKSGSEEE
ncbi:MAG: GLUG motif-containing protein [Anaerobutyricum sp.]